MTSQGMDNQQSFGDSLSAFPHPNPAVLPWVPRLSPRAGLCCSHSLKTILEFYIEVQSELTQRNIPGQTESLLNRSLQKCLGPNPWVCCLVGSMKGFEHTNSGNQGLCLLDTGGYPRISAQSSRDWVTCWKLSVLCSELVLGVRSAHISNGVLLILSWCLPWSLPG